jgi:hypothetical protein
MTSRRAPRLLTFSCVCALAALALMTWQLFDPRVFPIIVAMSLGQVLGTASFATYLYVVLDDFVRDGANENRLQLARSKTRDESVERLMG